MSGNANKNRYAQKAGRKALLKLGKHTAKDYKNAGKEVAKDLLAGAIGGGFIGAVTGRWSLLSGLAVSYIGHLKNSRIAQAIGLGMMSAGGLTASQSQDTVNGPVDGIMEKTKSQFKAMSKNLGEKLFLDKLPFGKKDNSETTEGLGDVKYFVYPSGDERSQLNMSQLDDLESALQRSAEAYAKQSPVSGELPEDLDEDHIY